MTDETDAKQLRGVSRDHAPTIGSALEGADWRDGAGAAASMGRALEHFLVLGQSIGADEIQSAFLLGSVKVRPDADDHAWALQAARAYAMVPLSSAKQVDGESSRDDLEAEVTKLTAQVRGLTEDRNSWRRVAERCEGESQAAEAKVAELEKERDLAEAGFQAVRQNRDHYQRRAEAAEGALAQADVAVEAAEAERDASTSKVEELRGALAGFRELVAPVMKALMYRGRDELLLADKVHKADDCARAALQPGKEAGEPRNQREHRLFPIIERAVIGSPALRYVDRAFVKAVASDVATDVLAALSPIPATGKPE